MSVVYEVVFQYEEPPGRLLLTRTGPSGPPDTSPVSLKEIQEIDETCRDFRWNRSADLSERIGKKLFDLLNGDRQSLVRALEKADDYGERLEVYVRPDKSTTNLPFELLYHSDFLVLSRIHLVRRVSDWGSKKILHRKNRPLRILFMACSPNGIQPVLEFEKEEDTIFEITKDLPVEIDVEDTGSLDGLAECLTQNKYDIVHLSGHADIDKQSMPLFLMENEEGLPVQVTASELWEKLNLNLPRLVFLSGCKTGEAPLHAAATSFAQHLVANHSSICLGWGLPVSDPGATSAAKQLYFELSRGKNILEAVLATRQELFKHQQRDWSLFRLFSDGTPMNVPLVPSGQKRKPKLRDLQYVYLYNSQVKVLKKGFVGRRRQIRQGLRCLGKDEEKVGLLMHGTGGLGKSCLAGKLCERLKDRTLIIVHGPLNAVTLGEALKDGFVRAKDKPGERRLKVAEEIPDKLRSLCSSSFRDRPYLILLDDFEKNLTKIKEGKPEISPEAVPIVEALLRYLPYSGKMTRLIITSRYKFPLTIGGMDFVKHRLETIGLPSFRGSDEFKKTSELTNIVSYPDSEVRQKLIEAGRGNPRLMEALDTLVGEVEDLDVVSLLAAVKDKQEEFVQNLVLRKIIESQTGEFQTFLQRSAVYRLPVVRKAIKLVSQNLTDWELSLDHAVCLSLMEEDSSRERLTQYWITPLLREEIFGGQTKEERKQCHQAAVSYYQELLSQASEYIPIVALELVGHALEAEMYDVAVEEEGKRLLPHMRGSLAYSEAVRHGEYVLSRVPNPKRDDTLSEFLFQLGWLYRDIGKSKKAIKYYQKALSIDREIYGEKHPSVAATLNNLGLAWQDLGDAKKAVDYFERALSIDREIYGEKHPSVATTLNNLGLAWKDLGDAKKAVDCYERALSIVKQVYGAKHPHVAATLNNLGLAWQDLGDAKKAVDYFERGLSIDREIYGEKHPSVATRLNNLGGAWQDLGDAKKAVDYYERALSIVKQVYGAKHPHVAATLNNLGSAWQDLGDAKKAVDYFERALSIDREIYGEKHPSVATRLNNLGGAWKDLGDAKKAVGYYERALSIVKQVYGAKHPYVAVTLNNLGGAWKVVGDSKKAIEYFQRAYNIFRKFYGDEHPYTRTTREWMKASEKKKK